ncbi:MAG TPA: MBL fold metallo-hydrolase [Frankiaceae bacterium]|jgi:beta-lactamase superfamily II metal-dependent hydrolase|nr:MBL fold metallo-hydrolase [Frankiaceae bacterium]
MTIETLPAAAFKAGDFARSVPPEALVYFLLNVGDGDTQLLLLPASRTGFRRAMVVDCATTGKLPALVTALASSGLLAEPPPGRPLFDVVVATHPHADHIGGMPEFMRTYGAAVGELWEPGYWHTVGSYSDLMGVLEDLENAGAGVRHAQPTSGYTRFIGQVEVTVLTPAIRLRNRFDTFGVEINNASIAMRLTFPASRVVEREGEREYVRTKPKRLLLGADAQTLSWAHAMDDFPELHGERSEAAKALRMAYGTDPLKANVFKVPHHLSKHGLNLELVELVGPGLSLVSSVAGGGKYNFPHAVAQEALREGLQRTTSGRTPRKSDADLGIHYTGASDSEGRPLGSIAVVMPPAGNPRLWRFGDTADQPVDLANARRWAG